MLAQSETLHPRRNWAAAILAVLLCLAPFQPISAAHSGPMRPRTHLRKPMRSVVPPGFDRLRIEVKFQDGLQADADALNGSRATQFGSPRAIDLWRHIHGIGARWRSASHVDRTRLEQLRSRAQSTLGRGIPDLTGYFVLTLSPGTDPLPLLDALNELPEVELASPLPLPAPPPSIPDFESLQGYLAPAPGGLDAAFAWTIPGGTGTGVAICDMEFGWNLAHEDLPPAMVMIPDGESASSIPSDDHGTAVLGAMHSLRNGWGTTGGAYEARCIVAPLALDSGYGLFQQILWAAAELEPGDVILIEQQTVGPNFRGDGTQTGYVPVEWQPSIYAAISTAVGNGIHVVEAGGNGNQNLDDAIYAAGNFGHAPFLPENNSGAIIVGAGVPPTAPNRGPDRARLNFSNYGSRVDLQGWGVAVATTGYGDLFDDGNPNHAFAGYFAGTSAASPLIASTVASIEGMYEQTSGTAVPPLIMRDLLRETGSPQQDGGISAAQEPIGPRPDLRAAVGRMNTPIVSAPAIVRANEGDTITVTIFAADLDGDPIELLMVGALPAGATFTPAPDNSRGYVEWIPQAGHAGSYSLQFIASNTETDTSTTRLEVTGSERGPVVTGPGGVIGIEGVPVSVTMGAVDPNGDEIVRFEASGLPRGAAFVPDSGNVRGSLTWTPDFDQAGHHVISFTATSISGALGGQEETGQGLLGLTIFNNDRPPVITAPSRIDGSEGVPVSVTVLAVDPDGDAITDLKADRLPEGAAFVPEADNHQGLFSWSPGFDQAGRYFVDFVAENARRGVGTTVIVVANVDRSPNVSAPHEAYGTEGAEISFTALAEDPDADLITVFEARGLPPGSEFTVDATLSSGRFSWVPRFREAGQYRLSLVATSRASLEGTYRSDSASVLLEISPGTFPARTILAARERTLRLGTRRSDLCIHVEPDSGDFDLAAVDPTSVTLAWLGADSTIQIPALPGEPQTFTDSDQNGIPELRACFSRADLRGLFGGIQESHRSVQAVISGRFSNGGGFEGAVVLEVVTQKGIRDVSVTPNPSAGRPVLSFYTSSPAWARLTVFDVQGRLVSVPWESAHTPAGFHDVPLEARASRRLAAGIYYYKLETVDGVARGKFALLK